MVHCTCSNFWEASQASVPHYHNYWHPIATFCYLSSKFNQDFMASNFGVSYAIFLREKSAKK